MKIGKLRKIPKETLFWSIALQETIKLEKDIIFEISNTCIDSNYVFGNIVEILYNCPGMIPGKMPKHNGEIEIMFELTLSYEMPTYESNLFF